jgi:hypothetical protein
MINMAKIGHGVSVTKNSNGLTNSKFIIHNKKNDELTKS